MSDTSSYRPSFFHDQPSITIFQQWLAEHDIRSHLSLSLAPMADSAGYRIISNEAIQLGSVLCTVPKSMIFSHRTCTLDTSSIPEPESSAEVLLRLVTCLLHELRLGKGSRWYGWLQVLPRDTVTVPLLWGVGEISGEDGKEAVRWSKGSELGREMNRQQEQDGLSMEVLRRYFDNLSLPSTPSRPSPPTLLDFLYIFSLISSRGFMLDTYHQIGIPPYCDMFNHSSTSAHTSLLCDTAVCPTCGSFQPCAHDSPDSDRLHGVTQLYLDKMKEEGESVDMRAERDITRGIEVFSCYEEGLTPAKALVGYGFLPDNLAGSGVTWKPRELLDGTTGPVFIEIMQNGRVEREVFGFTGVEGDGEGLLGPVKEGQTGSFELRGNGELSINTFVALYIRTVIQEGKEFDDLADLEETIITDAKLVGTLSSSSVSRKADGHLFHTLEAVITFITRLLQDRLSGLYEPQYSPEEIERMILALPGSSTLQRQAMQYAMSEKVLLQRTMKRWQELCR